MSVASDYRERQLISERTQLICVRCAIPMMLLLFGGLGYSGFLTPPAPFASAETIAREYRENTDQLRIGLAVSFFSIILFFPFGAALSAQARRIEGASPVLAYGMLAAIGSASLIFVLPWVCWQVGAFRPERGVEDIQLINDLGWLIFTWGFVAFTSWNFMLGLAILSDTRKEPIFPRWAGYYQFFVGLVFVPNILVVFFKSGPFSWRGVVPYWFPFTIYGIWIIVMMVLTTKAIKKQAQEPPEGPEGDSVPDAPSRDAEPSPVPRRVGEPTW